MGDMWKKCDVFLVCGGPSAARVNLQLLNRPGVMTMTLNNSWFMAPWSQLWTCVDPPDRFPDIMWRDPRVLKLCPITHKGLHIARMVDGVKVKDEARVGELPNVAYYKRANFFDPGRFFSSPLVGWGNTKKEGPCAAGVRDKRSVMLVALKLLHALGFGRVFLVGADFRMPDDMQEKAYACGEDKPASGRIANNRLYEALEKRFQLLQAYIQEAPDLRFRIINVTEGSALKAFPTMGYEDAVREALQHCDKEVPTEGWYYVKPQ